MLPQNPELFSWLNSIAMLGWALLIVSPRRWHWLVITTGIVIPSIVGLVYGGLMFTHFTSVEGGGYGSLAQVQAFMSKEYLVVAGWSHFLCFDLVIGTLIAIEGDKKGTSGNQIPILATFMFGPVGLLLFFICIGSLSVLKLSRAEV